MSISVCKYSAGIVSENDGLIKSDDLITTGSQAS